MTRLVACALLVVAGCAPAPSAPSPVPPPTAEPPAPPLPSPVATSPEPSPAPSPPPAPEAPEWPEVAFPPADLAPPSERSAAEGDGVWTRLGADRERAATGEAALFTTTIHPHPVSRFITVTLVAIDLAQLDLHWVPGTDDPRLDAWSGTPGLIPESDHGALVAVFNGGFAPRHGQWGMGRGDTTFVDARDDACAVTVDAKGHVAIRPWSEVTSPDRLRAWRQTPPCLLDDGALHPHLEAGNLRVWAGRDPKRKTRRRSGLGLDATGRILFYAMGEETEVTDLARGLKHAGAISAVELDINYSWTKFLLFGEPSGSGALQVTSTLIPDMKHSRRGYVERSAFRDFFYLVRR